MKKIFLTYSITVVFISLGLVNAKAQQTLKVGNNPTTVTNSAVLDVEATNKGALLPRVALTGTTDVTTIANPANALTVFNTATAGTAPNNVIPGYYFYSTSLNKWVKLVTTEEIKPNYKIVVDPINGDNHITSDAGLNGMGQSLAGSQNIAIGNSSMSSSAFSGAANTAVGYGSAYSLTSGTWNTLLGLASGAKVTTGEYNVVVGANAMTNVETGSRNTALGGDAMFAAGSNVNFSTAVGSGALGGVQSGDYNIGLGNNAGSALNIGSGNVYIGNESGNPIPAGGVNESNQLYINNGPGPNALIRGDFATKELTINNTLKVTGLNSAAPATTGNRPVVADANGQLKIGTDAEIITADNGLTKTGSNIQLGGALTQATTITTDATKTIALAGLQTGAVTDNVVVADANGVLKSISSSNITANNWSLTGNAGTTAGTNFLGTTDSQDLIFKTNNLERLRITQTGRLDFSNTSGSNTNIFLKGGNETTTGGNNIALGTQALPSNTTGSWNIGLGTQALQANTTGFLNTALGGASMIANTTGGWNTAIGVDGLRANTTGNYNTALGYRAGRFITTGSNNITIGWDAGLPSNTADGQMNIGNIIYATGRGAVGAGNLGVGITNPGNKLEIQHGTAGNSGLRFTNLTNAPLLATNASGDVISATANPANGLFWGLTGNSGTNPTNNYIGTRDAADFVVITNNTERMRTTSAGNVAIGNQTPATVASATSGSTAAQQLARLTVSSGDISVNGVTVGKGGGQLGTNLAFGVQTLYNNTTGNENIAIGVSSLNLNSIGSNNLAIGNNALYSNTADWNFAIGNVALQSNTTGTWNQGIGAYALNRNTTGGWNLAVGATAMQYNTTGMYNVALGNSALRNGNIASRNTAIGYRTLETSNGAENTAIGNQAGSLIGTGTRNTAVGDSTLLNVTTGNRNTALGDNALSNLFTGSNNIGIGASVQVPSQTASNQMNIGNTLFGTGMNGTLAAPAGFLGVNISAPTNTLHVKATADPLRLEGLQAGSNTDNVVVADANGVLKSLAISTLATEPWFNQASNTQATLNTQNIYQSGNVAIKKVVNYAGTALDVEGAVRGGTGNLGVVGANSAAFGNGNTASGVNSIALGSSTASGLNTFAAGTAVATGDYAVALGAGSATGLKSTAIGQNVVASNEYSLALGFLSTASGAKAVALGTSIASGGGSIAIGSGAVASGNTSVAIGSNITNQVSFGAVLGNLNGITTGDPGTWIENDAIFQIGNGNPSSTTRSNALTILKNGNTAIGVTKVTEAAAKPTERLDIGYDATAPIDATNQASIRVRGINDPYYAGNPSSDKVVVADANGVLKTVDKTTLAPTAIRTETANYTALAADETILVNANGGAVTITLPAANTATGKKYVVKKIDASANGVQVISAGGTIDGNAAGTGVTGTLSWQGWVFQSDGTNWFIISRI